MHGQKINMWTVYSILSHSLHYLIKCQHQIQTVITLIITQQLIKVNAGADKYTTFDLCQFELSYRCEFWKKHQPSHVGLNEVWWVWMMATYQWKLISCKFTGIDVSCSKAVLLSSPLVFITYNVVWKILHPSCVTSCFYKWISQGNELVINWQKTNSKNNVDCPEQDRNGLVVLCMGHSVLISIHMWKTCAKTSLIKVN